MKLLLVRHGETDWNLARRYQSYSDVPLNQTGIQQAQSLAKRLAQEKIGILYSSDLSRATETAKCIAQEYEPVLAIRSDPRWRELSFGKWEGLNHTELQAHWQAEADAWYADPMNVAPPDGETLLQMSKRLQTGLDELKDNHQDEAVLIVSHAGVIQVLLCRLLGVELNRHWQFHVAQASVTVLNLYENAAILDLFNDVSHLKAS